MAGGQYSKKVSTIKEGLEQNCHVEVRMRCTSIFKPSIYSKDTGVTKQDTLVAYQTQVSTVQSISKIQTRSQFSSCQDTLAPMYGQSETSRTDRLEERDKFQQSHSER